MKAYFVVYENVRDAQSLQTLAAEMRATMEPYQGRFLVRGGAFTTLEGEMPYQRIAVLEFPSRAAAESWYHSPEYQRLVPLRSQWAQYQVNLVDGVDS